MRDHELYARILGLEAPWTVAEVDLDVDAGEVTVYVTSNEAATLPCPRCGKACKRYDHRQRRWRHLDTCQYRTFLVADVPRVTCSEHGVVQVTVPWAVANSRFTALFESLVIDWLLDAGMSAVARRLGLTWAEADGVMARAVARGLLRRGPAAAQRLGVDETSFQKRHEYVTVVTDRESGRVLHVADDRKTESLEEYYGTLTVAELEAVESVAMDMWKPYIKATMAKVPDAEEKIAFDKFHVAAHLAKAVDAVRREENKQLLAEGDRTLVGSKHMWLKNPANMDLATKRSTFRLLKMMVLRTARAWGIKEAARFLWKYKSRTWATTRWQEWIAWAVRSRLEPIKRVAQMIRAHLHGIVNAVVTGATNAIAESINSKIQHVKRIACGYRNRERFRNAIYFHCGMLDLYPKPLATHTVP